MRRAVLTFLAFNLGGCRTADTPAAVSTTAPTPAISAPVPGPSSGSTVSGIVFETTAEGTRPLPGSKVVFVSGEKMNSAVTDQTGHYSISNIPNRDRVRIVAFPPIGLSLFQRTAVTRGVDGDATVDIELVSESAPGATYGSPTLSGVVYYMTSNGPRPWPNTPVVYKAFTGLLYDVYQSTDAQGRFDFGRLPLGSGELGAGNCNDAMMFRPVDIRGDTVANIDITWLVTTCPGVPF